MRLDQLMADHQYARKDIKQLLARRQILVDHLPAKKTVTKHRPWTPRDSNRGTAHSGTASPLLHAP